MNKLEFKSYAKINLALEIGKKRSAGYHEIRSIMQQINLFDKLTFKKLEEDRIIIKCNLKELENDGNICYKAALLLKNEFNIKEGIEIDIEKNIPIGSGLAGGSGNAAATLKALNEMFELNLSEDKLIEIGIQLGSDVPFQIIGGTALVEGIGEELTKLNPLENIDVLLINPNINISTKWAYEEFDKVNNQKGSNNFDKMLKGIGEGNLNGISENLYNDFEEVIFNSYPEIRKIKEDLIKNNALNALMSGSGSSVFGLFENKGEAEKTHLNLKDKYPFVCLTNTIR